MQHSLIVWNFPTVEGAWDACTPFAEYINAGSPKDCFDGFELKYRVCEQHRQGVSPSRPLDQGLWHRIRSDTCCFRC